MTSGAHRLLEAYRSAFEELDTGAVVELFAYPCQLIGDLDDAVSVSVVESPRIWADQVGQLIDAYRQLGVRRAIVEEARTTDLSPRVAVVQVRWRLEDASGEPIYAFNAAYTAIDRGDGHRIVAIAHDEVPELRAAIARLRAPARRVDAL